MPAVIVEFVDERLEKVSSDSVRKELSVLSLAVAASMALWGVELPANPVHTTRTILSVTKTLKGGVKRQRRPTDEELDVLCDNTPGVMPEDERFGIFDAAAGGDVLLSGGVGG